MRLAYEAMNDRLYREMHRYHEEKGEIMSEIVHHFAEHEAAFNQTGAETWKSSLSFIEDYKPKTDIEKEVDGAVSEEVKA